MIESGADTSKDGSLQDNVAKAVTLGDTQQRKEWTTSTKNPDYNLVQIHAANNGFMAKANPQIGSYLVYFFCVAVKRNIQRKQGKVLSDLMAEIQNTLHNKGKQQTVNVFNNNAT